MQFLESETPDTPGKDILLEGTGEVLTAEFAVDSLYAATRGSDPKASDTSKGILAAAKLLHRIDMYDMDPTGTYRISGPTAEVVVDALHMLAGSPYNIEDSIRGHRIDDAQGMIEAAYPVEAAGRHGEVVTRGRHAA